jgi:membrane fusion protein (multidrug efflux system)
MSQMLIMQSGNNSQFGSRPDHPYARSGSPWFRKPLRIMTGLCLMATLPLFHCGKSRNEDARADGRRFGPGGADMLNTAAIPVQAVPARRGDISLFLMQTTTIEAERQVEILAKVSGQVVRLPAEEGLRVKEGDLLAQLDEAELTINYMRSKVSYETDKSVYERSKEMLENNFIATEDYEAARLQYESSKAAFEAAKLQLEYTGVRAPFNGIVTVRNIELGQRVNVNQSLFTIADFDPLRAKIFIPEKDIARIHVGQQAKITVEAEPGEAFTGLVKMVSPVVDPESGTSKVTIDIQDENEKLKPGMFASVFITTETHQNTIIIPKKALVLESDLDQVYIYRDSLAHKVNLKIGFASGNDIEVLSGLKEGDLVVTAGQDGLREGLPIRIPDLERLAQSGTPGSEGFPVLAEKSADIDSSSRLAAVDPDQLKQMEERLMQNPWIKKEYERRLKEDPALKDDLEKRMAFFREMMQRRPSNQER